MPLINGYTIMDDLYYIETQFHILSYSELHTQPKIVIHLNSAATLLRLTPAELTPILCEQQEYLRDEYAQPLPNPARTAVHPNSTVAQLGLTTEEIKEVLRDQEDWLREEEQQEQEAGTAAHPTSWHQPQTAHLEPKCEVHEGYGMADEPPELTMLLEDSTQPNAHALWLERQHQTLLWHEM
jgi:hypothetical protein